MWEKETSLNEGKKYEVLDNQRFLHFAVVEKGKIVNRVTKKEIKNIVRIWQ